ncbi:MAG: PTS ascorbate-specific transporter subunit IIA, partial [Serratia marcescens]|nr:PTS ascorbate-specific transporter subunit IIA [Serratia marcescens]
MKLSDSLAQNNAIQLQAEAADWRQAVRLGVDLLVAAGVVEPRYFDAILAGVD